MILKYITISIFLLGSCTLKKDRTNMQHEKINPSFREFSFNCSIRAIEVIDKNTVWFAGSKGIHGSTKNAGNTWDIDSIKIGKTALEFRAISITEDAIFLLNVASPAYLLKSVDQGDNWDIVYQENHPDCFYNSMKFWDNQHGIAVGDPIEGCLSVLLTNDGGNHWRKLDCSELPATFDGEAGFAASNTNIALHGDQAWLATGGKKSRVFHSPDKGKTWEVVDSPIQEGGKMTGIFSIDFYDENQGAIIGGDWENQSINTKNKALTYDGGKTWQLINDGKEPGYRSCIQFISNSNAQKIIAIGIPGISYSPDGGSTWQKFDQTYFYTVRIAPSGNIAWLAGKNKIASMKF